VPPVGVGMIVGGGEPPVIAQLASLNRFEPGRTVGWEGHAGGLCGRAVRLSFAMSIKMRSRCHKFVPLTPGLVRPAGFARIWERCG